MKPTFHLLIYRVFHAQRNYLRPQLGEIGLEVGQPKLLAYLSEHMPCRHREFSDYFEIDGAAFSRMIDTLEKGGFVTRTTDAESRRSNLIELTEKGRMAHQQWVAHCASLEQQMLYDFDESEREQFAAYLARAYQNLRMSPKQMCPQHVHSSTSDMDLQTTKHREG